MNDDLLPKRVPTSSPHEDRRVIIEYLCSDLDIPNDERLSENSRIAKIRLLRNIAIHLGISKADYVRIRSLPELCNLLNVKIIEMDIISFLAECKKNIALIELKSITSRDPSVVVAELEQMREWYDKLRISCMEASKAANLRKMVELRNQLKGSCDTFTKVLLEKIADQNKVKAKKKRFSW